MLLNFDWLEEIGDHLFPTESHPLQIKSTDTNTSVCVSLLSQRITEAITIQREGTRANFLASVAKKLNP